MRFAFFILCPCAFEQQMDVNASDTASIHPSWLELTSQFNSQKSFCVYVI